MKQCVKCQQHLSLDNFYIKKNSKPHPYCTICNKEIKAQWFAKNRDEYLVKMKNNYIENKSRRKSATSKRYRDNLSFYREYNKQYYLKNKDKLKERKQASYSKKYKEDTMFKMKCVLRSRLSIAIKKNYKSGSAVSNLGCSIEQFKKYLESKFEPGMTWYNWSRTGWHIDHIKPLSSFDLSDPEELKKACHYSNLQPLWWYDNLSKGANL